MAKVKISDLTAAAALDGTELIEGEQDGGSVKITAQDIADLAAAPYLKYVALLTQSGTDAPVATVLENTLGGTVVWTRNDVGDYTGTLAGAFTENKTFMLVAVNGEFSSSAAVIPYTINVDSIGFYSMDSANNPTELEGGASIEIRVYP